MIQINKYLFDHFKGPILQIISCAVSSSTTNLEPEFLNFLGPKNRFQGINSASVCSLAGRYDNPIPTPPPPPRDSLKIPALYSVLSWIGCHSRMHTVFIHSKSRVCEWYSFWSYWDYAYSIYHKRKIIILHIVNLCRVNMRPIRTNIDTFKYSMCLGPV